MSHYSENCELDVEKVGVIHSINYFSVNKVYTFNKLKTIPKR
jgi:hypothetical protein